MFVWQRWENLPTLPDWAKETGKVLAPPVLNNITGYVGVALWLDSKSERRAELLNKATNAEIKSIKDSSDAQIKSWKDSSDAQVAAIKTSTDAQVALRCATASLHCSSLWERILRGTWGQPAEPSTGL